MKILLVGAALGATTLSSCVLPPPPPLITVQPAPIYERPVVYSPGYTITTLSPGYRTVRYRRQVYYVDRDTYYRRHHGGYVVVQRPY